VQVKLGDRSYSILIGHNLLDLLGSECAKLGLGKRCAVICDRKVARGYGRRAMASLSQAGFEPLLLTVPGGEPSKSLKIVHSCYDALARHRLERRSFVVALGGGVVGDLAGFVAATYLRGIPFVQVPTTLLAQVDSSVGGKVGVNLKAGKNLVGAFHQPRFVLCDIDTLRTLPAREFRAGLAEVIKYGIICDAGLFERLERDLPLLLKMESTTLTEVVGRCCEIKAGVVAQDETESGLRQILNFGHTIGHAIEATSGYGKFLHGEAIAIGQVAAAQLSVKLLDCARDHAVRVKTLFERARLPTKMRITRPQLQRLIAAMRLDKKVSAGDVTFILMERIGAVRWGQKVPLKSIDEVLR
jgi:3-dehydroquinate synthase